MKFGKGSCFNDSYCFENSFFGSSRKTRSYLGLPQWRVDEWKGIFYSKKCSQKDYLNEYSKFLNTVEVSSTFYSFVPESSIDKWVSQVGDNFRFLPKWPKEITHDRFLRKSDELIEAFIVQLERFGEKLGTSLLQLPPEFSVDFKSELFLFLKQINGRVPIAIEFRHESWFEGERVFKKLESYLSAKKISMVCTDTPDRRDVFHKSFTGGDNVIRFLSDGNLENDQRRVSIWRDYINNLADKGNFYFIIHRENNELAPSLIEFFDAEVFNLIKEELLDKQLKLI